MIAKPFRQGRQEDAHEFLRYFVDALQKSCLQGLPSNLDPHSKATTVVHKIFGGYHRSQGEEGEEGREGGGRRRGGEEGGGEQVCILKYWEEALKGSYSVHSTFDNPYPIKVFTQSKFAPNLRHI